MNLYRDPRRMKLLFHQVCNAITNNLYIIKLLVSSTSEIAFNFKALRKYNLIHCYNLQHIYPFCDGLSFFHRKITIKKIWE